MQNSTEKYAECVGGIIIFCLGFYLSSAFAMNYTLETPRQTLIGQTRVVFAEYADTLPDLARRYNLGYTELKLANPEVDIWLPGDERKIILPTQFILPHAKRQGLVLNVPEMRLYFYPPGQDNIVITYPLGIGKKGWATPYMRTRIIQKQEKPNWYPTESIRKEHKEAGDPLPKVVPAGEDNPLGEYALRLSMPEYLIHGTNKPYGVGMRVSHGCIRLYPEDIAALFERVSLNTPVNIINQPYKVGVQDKIIYLEAHPFMEEDEDVYAGNLIDVLRVIVDLADTSSYMLDWEKAMQEIQSPSGIPVAIGFFM